LPSLQKDIIRILIRINCHILIFSKEFSLKSDSEFTIPSEISLNLGQNLKKLEPCIKIENKESN